MLKFTDDECLAVIAEAGIAWDIPFPSVDVRDPVALLEAQERGFRSLQVRDFVHYRGGRSVWVPELERIMRLCHEVTLIGRIVATPSFDTAPERIVVASGSGADGGLVHIDAAGVHTIEFPHAVEARRHVVDAALDIFEDVERSNCYLLSDALTGGAWIVSRHLVQRAVERDSVWHADGMSTLDEVYRVVLGERAVAA